MEPAVEDGCAAGGYAAGARSAHVALAGRDEKAQPGVRAARGGTLLDARRAVLRREAPSSRPEPAITVAVAGHYYHTRSESGGGLPVWFGISERCSAARSGGTGPSGRVAAAGHCGEPRCLAPLSGFGQRLLL